LLTEAVAYESLDLIGSKFCVIQALQQYARPILTSKELARSLVLAEWHFTLIYIKWADLRTDNHVITNSPYAGTLVDSHADILSFFGFDIPQSKRKSISKSI